MTENRLPVFETLNEGLKLLGNHWRDYLLIAWAPLLLSAILQTWPITRLPDEGVAGLNPEDMSFGLSSFNTLSLIASLIGILILAMVLSGLFRLFLREERPDRPWYLHWGADEWNMTGAVIVTMGVFLSFAVVFIMVFGAASAAAGSAGAAIIGLIGMLGALAGGFWVLGRTAMLYPGTIARERLSVLEYWRVGKGNEFRIAAIMVLFALLAMAGTVLVAVVLNSTILFGTIGDYWDFTALPEDDAPVAFSRIRVLIGAFVFNLLVQVPTTASTALYAVIWRRLAG